MGHLSDLIFLHKNMVANVKTLVTIVMHHE